MALALALAKRPELLVLDEPVSSLDSLARREFLQTLMGAVGEQGVTVLFSSHVMHELERVCDYLVVLNHGRVTLRGEIEDLLAGHRLVVGPRAGAGTDRLGTVVEATQSDRHTSLLVRHAGEPVPEGWLAHPFAFALAAAAGVLLRRSIAGLAVATMLFIVVRVAVEGWLRPEFKQPQTLVEAIPERGPASKLERTTLVIGCWIRDSLTARAIASAATHSTKPTARRGTRV